MIVAARETATHRTNARQARPEPRTATCSERETCDECDAQTVLPAFGFGQVSIGAQSQPRSGLRRRGLNAVTTAALFPTPEGTETIDVAPDTTTQGPAPDAGAINQCTPTGRFTTIPSGNLAPTLSAGKLGATFRMVGAFTTPIPCTCSCGEYRQFVRGSFTSNGSTVTHPLCGTNLHPTTWQEDCARIGGTDYKYGYRSNRFATSRFTNPDQATGCTFEGDDAPGITGSSGDVLGVDLQFIGRLVDSCDGDRQLASSAWSVRGTATVP